MVQVDAGVGFQLPDQEFAQAPMALRAVDAEAVGGERPAFAAQRRIRRGDHTVDRELVLIAVAADEVVFRHAGEFGRRRRQAGAQQRREIEGIAHRGNPWWCRPS